jgi:hypothetical protein
MGRLRCRVERPECGPCAPNGPFQAVVWAETRPPIGADPV